MVRKIFFRHQKSLRHLAMTLTKYSISAHLGAPRRGLRGDVMVTCHGTKTRHGNTLKSHTNVMVFLYRWERATAHTRKHAALVAALLRWISHPNRQRLRPNDPRYVRSWLTRLLPVPAQLETVTTPDQITLGRPANRSFRQCRIFRFSILATWSFA